MTDKLSNNNLSDNEGLANQGHVLRMLPVSASRALGKLMLILIFGFAVNWTYIFFFTKDEHVNTPLIVAILILLICYRESRAGRAMRGIIIFCWGVWMDTYYLAFTVAGIRTPILLIVPCLIMIIAWIQGRRAMLFMAGLSGLLAVLVNLAETAQMLPPAMYRNSWQILLVFLCVIAISGIIAVLLAENFKNLIEKSWQLTGELQARVSELKNSELALKELNDKLEQRVEERTSQFNEANKTLQNTVNKLELAQTELVNAEKMAALGSMVAGISHELNTPIGNVLMIATSMEKQCQDMIEKAAQGAIKRSEFEDFMKTGHEMAMLAVRSTNRAVDLVSSFKQVAVDQTSEQRRSFDLRVVVEDNIATLLPSIKNQSLNLQINNLVPAQITCDSFPGPLGQVIINLAQNSILHGFDNVENGTITVRAFEHDDSVTVTVSDDGVGIAPHNLSHIFDPFFTTKLGKGGSGLGLSVSYRIVTSVLGGNMFATSSLGHGAQFTLVFPKIAPFKF